VAANAISYATHKRDTKMNSASRENGVEKVKYAISGL